MIQEKSNGTDTNDDKDEPETTEGGGYKNCGRGGRGKWWGKRGGRGGGYWCGYPGFQQQLFNQMFGGQQQQQQQQGCPKKDNGNNSKEENNPPGYDGHQSFPTGEEYLKNVGSAVSDFLKPFGIDVDVSVDHNGIKTSCSAQNPQKEGGNAKQEEEQPTCSKNAASNDEKDEKSEQTPPAPAPFTVPVKVVHEKKMKKDDVKQDKASSHSSDEGEWTMVKDEDEKPSDITEEKQDKKEKEAESPKKNDATESSARPRQPGPLDLLLAMGFKDENGSLARLLQACQNDIGKVLENMEKMNLKM